MDSLELFSIFFWIVCMFASALIAGRRGNPEFRAAGWALLLGPIGILVAAATPINRKMLQEEAIKDGELKRCTACAEGVSIHANTCRFCGQKFS